MQSRPIYDYYWFGTCLRFLQDASEGMPLGPLDGSAIRFNLARFFDYLEELDLQVTTRAAAELRDFVDELLKQADDHTLTSKEAEHLRRILKTLRTTLDAELEGFEAFVVTPKRLDTQKLLKNVEALLAPGVYDRLAPIAQLDLAEAGKCIAFERPTAAAFHLLRATEAVLRQFYCRLIRRGRSELMWGPMCVGLAQKPRFKRHVILIRNLDNIRHSFRNPTQHPDKTYDIHEVQDLWGLCVDAINRMAATLS